MNDYFFRLTLSLFAQYISLLGNRSVVKKNKIYRIYMYQFICPNKNIISFYLSFLFIYYLETELATIEFYLHAMT